MFASQYCQASRSVIVTFALVMALPAMADPRNAVSRAQIPMVECEVDGFGLGGSADQMRTALGEPQSMSIAKSWKDEYPHREYHYDGLRIVFSTHVGVAISYFVSSSKYRLRSGIGVGSTRSDIEDALGPGLWSRSGDIHHLTYLVSGVPTQLTFRLDDDVASFLSVVTR